VRFTLNQFRAVILSFHILDTNMSIYYDIMADR